MSSWGRSSPTSAGGRCRSSTRAAACSREHAAVRERVGLFDVSHLGKVAVAGRGRRLRRRHADQRPRPDRPGQAQYTLCCDDASGGVVDDLIVYLRADDDVLLVPNAANTAEVVRRLAAAAPGGVEVTDEHERVRRPGRAGPAAATRCSRRSGCRRAMTYMRSPTATWQGAPGHPSAARATPASAATSCCRRLGRRRRAVGRVARRRRRPRASALRARRPRHPAHRDGLPAARPRAVARHHARCRRVRLGGRLVEARVLGRDVLVAERERGAARLLWGLARARARRPAARPAGVGARRRRGRRGHTRHILADPAAGHRAGAARPPASARATRSSSTSGAGRCGARRQAAVRRLGAT